MTWFWLNIPLCVLILGAVCGIPMWLVIRHPDTAPQAIADKPARPPARPVALGASSGQSQDDGVQGQPHARPHHRAVDADELQIAPEEQFQLA